MSLGVLRGVWKADEASAGRAAQERGKAGSVLRGLRVLLVACALCCMMGTTPCEAAETGREGNLGENVQNLYTAGSGLLSTATTAIAQTDDGFVWIGGYGGLVRFDGRNFEPCKEGELGSIEALLADSRGRLWIAADDFGLACYEDGRYTTPTEAGKTDAVVASALAQDNDGKIWFGTESGIGYVDDALQVITPNIQGLQGEYIIHILPTKGGDVLCVTRGGELFRVSGEVAQRVDLGENTKSVRSIAYDDLRKLYFVGTLKDGFLILDENLSLMQSVKTPGLDCINDLLADKDGILWLCSDSGVGSYDGKSVRVQSLDMDNSIDGMMIDQEGSFWFISSRQGVLEVCSSRFGNVSRSAGLESMVVNAIAARDGRLYIGHDNGVAIIDAASYEKVDDPAFSALEGVRVRSILNDGKGGLWFFTKGKGALHFNDENACTVYSSEEYPQIASDTFRCGLVDGDFVLAGADIGAYSINGDSVSSIAQPEQELSHRVLCIGGSQGHYWLGTDGYGLYEVRNGEVVRHLQSEDGLGSNIVMKIVPGKAQPGWWLVLGNGLVWMDEDGSSFRQVRLNSSNILDFVILEDGRVWIPAGNGIFYSTEESLLAGDEAAIRLYRSSEGIPYEITANSNQCIHADTLFFCGTGGVVSLNLQEEDHEQKTHSLALDYIMVDGEKLYVQGADRCRIPPEAHRIDFDVHALTYRTEKPDVYYFLEGFDTGQTVVGLQSLGDITYTNLSAGNYVFHFGIANSEEAQAENELRISFVKEPRWFEQIWVQALIVLTIAALIAILVWRYIRLRVRNEERALRQRLEAEERDRLRHIAYKDYLTGLYNRNYLSEWRDKILPQVEWPLYFVEVDCNGLKQVNDRYGHAQGDELLRKLSGLLGDEFSEDGTLFRIGGDEFLLLIGGISRQALDERIKRVHDEAAQIQVRDVPLSFCEGVFEMECDACSFDEAMTKADMDLLHNKDLLYGRTSQS